MESCTTAGNSPVGESRSASLFRPGARDENGKVQPLDVKPGNRVLFGKWSGTEVRIDGEDLLIMKESDIMGIIEGAAVSRKAA
jgi:chaperonin GroES